MPGGCPKGRGAVTRLSLALPAGPGTLDGAKNREFMHMNWVAPIVEEICVGMEITSYESAELDVGF